MAMYYCTIKNKKIKKMKSKLLLILLFISSYTFAQTWSQVGATQFTDDASSAAMAFDSAGTPYVVYTNTNENDKAYVKTFNGTNWVDIVTPEVAATAAYNVAIKFDPTTNDLFVAFKKGNNNMSCYKLVGSTWTSVFTNINPGSVLANDRLQMQFNGVSTVRVAGRTVNRRLTIVERDASGAGPNLSEALYSNPTNLPHFYRYDFTSFSKYYLSWESSSNNSRVSRKAVGSAANTHQYTNYQPVTTMRNVSGIDDENYLAALDYKGTNSPAIKRLKVYHNATIIHTTPFTDNILKFRKNTLDDKLYLMYSDGSSSLTFKKYNKTSGIWSTLPQIGIGTSAASFFTDMEINPVDNNIYTYYLDAGKISVKKYTVSLCDPENVQVSNVSTTTADVTWNAPVTSTTNWEIALVPQGQPLSNGTFYSSNTNSFSFTGLTPSTPYDVYVRALCSGTLSVWTTPVAFLTADPPIYVDLNATAGNLDGTSWTDAYTNIQDAIDNATSGQQIWVAQGTYMPTTSNTNLRKATYRINKILSIYGGFQGNETQVAQRDAVANITILSGDLNMNDNTNIVQSEATRSDNAYHVVTLGGNFNEGAVVDGFTITSGNANGSLNHVSNSSAYNDETGGAIYANPTGASNRASAEFKNCIIEKNTAKRSGVMDTYSRSGATVTYTKVDFTSTIIRNNNSSRSILNYAGSETYNNRRYGDIVNCLITNNESSNSSYPSVLYAGVVGSGSVPVCSINIINSTIANNISNSTWVMTFKSVDVASTINNSIIYNNGGSSLLNLVGGYTLTASNSIIEGGQLSSLNVDPKFNNVASQDYSLDATSPAIDTGNNSLLSTSITKDVVGNDRVFNTTIDMGALEYFTTVVTYDLTVSKIGSGFVTPTVGVHSYNDGTVVSLTAAPATGWVFDKWSGDVTTTNSSETITINANKSVTAEFKQIQHTLTVNIVGNGTVTRSVNPVGGTYTYGTGVTLTAVPAAGYQFDGWSGASTQVTLSTVVIMDADKTVTANFSQIQYELTLTATNGSSLPDSGTLVGGVYTYNSGAVVIITPTGNTGYSFVRFDITDSSGVVTSSTSNPLSITMTDHMYIETFFATTASIGDNVFVDLKIFPNPVMDILKIELNEEISQIEIYNMLGQKVVISELKNINVTDLKMGTYLIKINTLSKKSITKLFIKK
jgi:uncharacterized repeat protein (TIGR02543 family)